MSPGAEVEQVMEMMKDCRVRRVLVTEGGSLVGIIAQADLALREGPAAPPEVEAVLEAVSEPAQVGAVA